MSHWARHQYKQAVIDVFLCALQASAADSSTKTISAKNFWLTAAASLGPNKRTIEERRRLKSRRSKSDSKEREFVRITIEPFEL